MVSTSFHDHKIILILAFLFTFLLHDSQKNNKIVVASSAPSSSSYFTLLSGLDSVIDGDNVPVTRFITLTPVMNVAPTSPRTITASPGGDADQLLTSIPQALPFIIFDRYHLSSNSSPSRQFYAFPAHIHQGFLEIRYITAGSVQHEDVCGGSDFGNSKRTKNRSVLGEGGFHVLNALGGGIAHEERFYPSPTSSLFKGFQLWFDVPPSKRQENKGHAFFQKSFYTSFSHEEVPTMMGLTMRQADDNVENAELEEETDLNGGAMQVKCLGYHRRTQFADDDDDVASILESYYCKNAPIRKASTKKGKKKSLSKQKSLDFSPFFDYFLMMELSGPILSCNASVENERRSATFRYPLSPEFGSSVKTKSRVESITCLAYFDASSSAGGATAFVNGVAVPPGSVKVEVLNRKDFDAGDGDEVFIEFQVPSSPSCDSAGANKLLYVCAANQLQDAGSHNIFHAKGMVFHSKNELDEAMQKIKGGNFKLNC